MERLRRSGLDSIIRKLPRHGKAGNDGYGALLTPGQLGNATASTFWDAARLIVEQCRRVLRPGAPAVWICKDFVRDGKRVRFAQQWLTLCESVGFESFLIVKASLVKECREASLFGGDVVRTTARKSFFRRLHERKLATDDERRIDEETVLFTRA